MVILAKGLRLNKNFQKYLSILPEVQEALDSGKPVVSLESTLVAFGMAWPENLATGRMLEQEIRQAGAIPATIALIEGKACIGLRDNQMELLATGRNTTKVSRRDIASVLTKGGLGATTVAATMIFSELAGIRLFATGGIGGVHREGHLSMDVSADLAELARTRVAVVCAGAKSVLDIGRTLEYLETWGVPVIGYGSDQFPAFYTRDSGFGLTCSVQTPADAARLLKTHWELGLESGIVLANPIPEAFEQNPTEIEAAIKKALAHADLQKIAGKDITPFLLASLDKLTDGSCVKTNIELARNNARVAAEIAVSLCQLT